MKQTAIFICIFVALLTVSKTIKAQDALYTASIQESGAVVIDFDLEEANKYSTSFLDHPARITKSAEAVGLKGNVVELLKTNIGPDWNPTLLMRTVDGNVFLLNIREIIDIGDYTCGLLNDIKDAVALKAIKQDGQFWKTPAAILKNGKTAFILGTGAYSGYYVIDGHDLVVHITSDYGINITDKQGEPIVCGTWYQSWGGSGMIVMSCSFDGENTEIDMYLDEDPANAEMHPSFKIHSIPRLPGNLLPFDEKLPSTLKYQEPY